MTTEQLRIVYAGFWWRVLAYLLDGVVLAVGLVVLGFFIGLIFLRHGAEEPGLEAFFGLFGFLAVWLYFALMESSAQQATLGKKACGLRVTDLDGDRISFARATGRHFAKIISGLVLAIGYVMVAFTARKQGLHDKIAGTLVVRLIAPAPRLRVEPAGDRAADGK